MHPPPNRSAQEAALTAVNLAPAAEPSADAPAPQPSHAETLTNTHGLLILERTPDGLPSWLACKFCPIFGCRTRNKKYLMLYMAPFTVVKIEAHLAKEHPAEWDKFKDLDQDKKKLFFRGKKLPSPEKFRIRLDELKKAWCPTKPPRSKKRKREKTSKKLACEESLERLAKRRIIERETHSVDLPLLSHDEDWVGRISFKSPVTKPGEHPPGQAQGKPGTVENGLTRRYAPLPGRNVYQHLRAILQRYSEPFSHDLHQLVNQPLAGSESETQEGVITPVWTDKGKDLLAARALFYLLRGIPADVTATFLKESNHVVEEWKTDACEKPDTPKNPDVDEAGNKEETDAAEEREDVDMTANEQDSDSLNKSQAADTSNRPRDWTKVVSMTVSSVGMASLLALRRIVSERQRWGLVIITRPCPVRKDAVEVLIPVSSATSGSSSTMLIAPELSEVPARQTDKPPMQSSAQSTGTDVGDTTDTVLAMQEETDIRVSDLVSLIFSEWLLRDERRSDRPAVDRERMKAWVRGRVEMCLKSTLAFLSICRGPTRAKNNIKLRVDNENIYTGWITATSSDDAGIQRARANYSLWEPGLRESEWQAEKQVLHGLAICFQKALKLTRGMNFSATLMQAKATVNKAITDFGTIMPITITAPPLPLDPLHVVSVREGNHAVDTVIGLLNFVCPHWPSQLIGVRSGIPDDAVGKSLEQEIVQALQARRTDELNVVDESIPDEKRPIYPRILAEMTSDNFRGFVNNYIKETADLENGFIEKIVSQHEILRLKEDGKEGLKKSWTEYEHLTQLKIFVRGLEVLWGRDQRSYRDEQCRFSGLVYDEDEGHVVDAKVEHVLKARALIEIEQTENLDEELRRVQGRDVAFNDCLIRWGENWSNLLCNAHVRCTV